MSRNWVDSQLRRVSKQGVFSGLFTITPHIADELLSRNNSNRALSSSYVHRLAVMMRNGTWTTNGETIVVSRNGELNDGQHRLAAVVESGVSIRSFIVFGVERQSRETVDTGRKRTPGDVLGMLGMKSSHKVAAAARAIMNYQDGNIISRHREVQEIVAFCQDKEGIAEAANKGTAIARVIGGLPSNWGALVWLTEQRHPIASDQFFDHLISGLDIGPDSPIYILRQRVIERPRSRVKLTDQELFAITVKAFNAFVSGQGVKALRWTEDGNEPMPKIMD